MSEQSIANWVHPPLDMVTDIVRGVSYKKGDARDTGEDNYLPILRANNIQDGKLVIDDLVYVPKENVKDHQLIKRGDIVVAMSSGSKKLVGKSGLSNEDHNAAFGTFCGVLRPKKQLNSKYIGLFTRSKEYLDKVSDLSKGVNINNLKPSHFSEILIPLPPLNEQTRIANKLDSLLAKVDAAQSRLEKIPTLLKRFRQSVLAAATSGELTREWREENQPVPIKDLSIKVQLERKAKGIKESKLSKELKTEAAYFDIPDSWLWVRLGHLALKITDGAHNTPKIEGQGYPYLMAKNLTGGALDFSKKKFISHKDHKELHLKCIPEIGDLLIVNIGAGTGNNALINVEFEFSFKNIAIIKKPSFMVSEYLKYFFDAYKQRIFDEQTRGGAQPFLSLTVLNDIPFVLPSQEEQTEIVRRVESLFALADVVEKQYQAAKLRIDRLTQSLLAKAFRGELVPQDPNDEPAAELLKRIQAERAAQAPVKRSTIKKSARASEKKSAMAVE